MLLFEMNARRLVGVKMIPRKETPCPAAMKDFQ
jgi:hypothetical protein